MAPCPPSLLDFNDWARDNHLPGPERTTCILNSPTTSIEKYSGSYPRQDYRASQPSKLSDEWVSNGTQDDVMLWFT
jgi:hypothetical protein